MSDNSELLNKQNSIKNMYLDNINQDEIIKIKNNTIC